MALGLFWVSALALAAGYLFFAWLTSGKFGSVIQAIRDDEARVRFLGYNVEGYKLLVFTVSAMVAGIAGAIYYPQSGQISPSEILPIASIYLVVWVAIGGRGRLYGAVIGAALVTLLQSYLTGGGAPDINLGFGTLRWVDWWTVLLGLVFVAWPRFFSRAASAGSLTSCPKRATSDGGAFGSSGGVGQL